MNLFVILCSSCATSSSYRKYFFIRRWVRLSTVALKQVLTDLITLRPRTTRCSCFSFFFSTSYRSLLCTVVVHPVLALLVFLCMPFCFPFVGNVRPCLVTRRCRPSICTVACSHEFLAKIFSLRFAVYRPFSLLPYGCRHCRDDLLTARHGPRHLRQISRWRCDFLNSTKKTVLELYRS